MKAEQIEVARCADILATAQRHVELRRVAAKEWAGPCKVCGGTDRFSVNTAKAIWNCRGCRKGGDVIDLVRHWDGLTFEEAIEKLTGIGSADLAATRVSQKPASDRNQCDKARWLWGQRRPLGGTIGKRYLRQARHYNGPLPATLGFLPAGKYPPSIICAFAMPDEARPGVLAAPDRVDAVQLIALEEDGSGKADIAVPKRTIGTHCGVPIVVAPVNDLLGLAICEGVEDALTAHEATGLGAWASGASFLPKLADAIPPHVDAITIFAHEDAGMRDALELARRLETRPIEVSVEGAD